jgi:hypothetical protein
VVVNPSNSFGLSYISRDATTFINLPYYANCKVSTATPFISTPSIAVGGPYSDYFGSSVGVASDVTLVSYAHLESALNAKGRIHCGVFT